MRFFTKLDLRNAYHLMQLKGKSGRPIYYTFGPVDIGLTNAPAVFQTLMNDVLYDMLNQFLLVYVADTVF